MKKLSGLLICLLPVALMAQSDSLNYYYQTGIAAYENKNYEQFLGAMERANSLRPNHPTLIYNLASAYALTGNKEKSLEILRKVILMNAESPLKEDADFTSLLSEPGFKNLMQFAEELKKEHQSSRVAFEIDTKNLHPEGMTFNAESKVFFFGGVHERKVISINAKNEIRDIIGYEKDEDIYCVMGLEYDDKTNILWICTAALPQMKNYTDQLKGHSSLFSINVESGKILSKQVVTGNHAFGDLTLNKSGNVFVSDGGVNIIYTLDKNNELEVFGDLSDEIFNLQGIAFTEDDEYIYLSDYITGIYRLNVITKAIEKVLLPADIAEKGIDGLYYFEGKLLAVQNGTTPNRTLHLTLDKDGTAVVASKVIDQALEVLDEPTQGMIIGDEFYYIANSPWGAYDKENNLLTENIKKTVILKYKVK